MKFSEKNVFKIVISLNLYTNETKQGLNILDLWRDL